MTVDEGQAQIIEIRFRLEYRDPKSPNYSARQWRTMYGSVNDGSKHIITKTLDECQAERTRAIRRHRPYGRNYEYRIVKITEEVVG